MTPKLSKTDVLVLQALERFKGATCSTVGAELWGRTCRNPQSYARPAGRALSRLKRRGLVEGVYHFSLLVWFPTEAGLEALGANAETCRAREHQRTRPESTL